MLYGDRWPGDVDGGGGGTFRTGGGGGEEGLDGAERAVLRKRRGRGRGAMRVDVGDGVMQRAFAWEWSYRLLREGRVGGGGCG